MFNELIEMKRSRKSPVNGDIFVLQPFLNIYYYGKVIQANVNSNASCFNGWILIYIYDVVSDDKCLPKDLDKEKLLIAPLVVNKQPWLKGYFENIGTIDITEKEKNIDFGFLNLIYTDKKFVNINDDTLEKEPEYWSFYGLSSYGSVGRKVHKVLNFRLNSINGDGII